MDEPIYKYIGSDPKLKNYLLANVTFTHSSIFKVRGDVLKPLHGYSRIVGKVYYISWVMFVSDWVMMKWRVNDG